VNNIWVPVTIASVVEGDGERQALPRLLHRIAAELGVDLRTPKPPFRIPRSKLVTSGGIERAIDAQASEVTGAGGILVLFDADDDCPAQLGPQLLTRARAARSDKRVAVVLAKREFEAWFLAALPSLAGQYGFPDDLPTLDNPETPRDCKGRLTKARGHGLRYSPTVDQAPLASIFDMKMARSNLPSFDKVLPGCGLVAWRAVHARQLAGQGGATPGAGTRVQRAAKLPGPVGPGRTRRLGRRVVFGWARHQDGD